MIENKGRMVSLLLAVLASLFLSSCGDSGSTTSANGSLAVMLTDAADPLYNSVVITIREVRAVPNGQEDKSDGGLPLVARFDPPRPVEILDLAYQQDYLGETVLPAGRYSQVRLVLADNLDPADPANYIVLASDPARKIPLKTPSGQTSGLKVLASGKFEVRAGTFSAVLIDFDPMRAIVESGSSGNWHLKPTGIRLVRVDGLPATFGAVAGAVLPAAAWDGAVVSLVPEGGSTAIAAGEPDREDGTFRAFVPAGNYELRIAAPGYAPYSSLPQILAVTAGADTAAGTVTLVPLGP